jgi:hypothetical protein
LSVDAFHASVTVVCVLPGKCCPCGTEGASVSGHALVEALKLVCGE